MQALRPASPPLWPPIAGIVFYGEALLREKGEDAADRGREFGLLLDEALEVTVNEEKVYVTSPFDFASLQWKTESIVRTSLRAWIITSWKAHEKFIDRHMYPQRSPRYHRIQIKQHYTPSNLLHSSIIFAISILIINLLKPSTAELISTTPLPLNDPLSQSPIHQQLIIFLLNWEAIRSGAHSRLLKMLANMFHSIIPARGALKKPITVTERTS
jgi:hypothetical protein